MKVCALLMLIVLVAGLCVTADAGRIYATGGGDGQAMYQQRYYYDGYDFQQPPTSSTMDYYLAEYTNPTIYLSGSVSHTDYAPRVFEDWTYKYYGVLIFSLAGIRSSGFTGPVTLSFYGKLGDDASRTTEWAWWHKDADLGGSVVADHSPLKGAATQFSYQNPHPNTYAWMSLNVTSQIQQDLNRGYNYSAFMLGPTVTSGIHGELGTPENGYGAYLSYVPEPASVVSLLAGLGGILGLALRRRRVLP